MRKLAWMALALAGISQAAGCIFTSEEGGSAFHASWTFTVNGGAPNSSQEACDALGAAWFSVLSTDSLGNGVDDQFPCANLEGTTGELPAPDTYTIIESLLDAGKVLVPGTDLPPFVEDLPADTVVELDTVNYDIQTTSHLRLFVDYGNAGGSNCDETAVGGSGVIQQQIFIMDTGGQVCLNVTGTDHTGAPFSTDTCGDIELCMETTVAQEFDIEPGSYTIEVLGFKGATGGSAVLCYQTSGALDVAGSADVTVVAPFAPDPADEAACNATKPDRSR